MWMVQISLVLSPCCCKVSLEQIEFANGSDAGSSNFASQEISVKKKKKCLLVQLLKQYCHLVVLLATACWEEECQWEHSSIPRQK